MNQIQRPATGRKRSTIVHLPSAFSLGIAFLALLGLVGCSSKKSAAHVFRLIDHLDQVEFLASPFPELIAGEKPLAPKDKVDKILARRNSSSKD